MAYKGTEEDRRKAHEKIRAYSRAYSEGHREERRAYNRSHRERNTRYVADKRRAVKSYVREALGGKCACCAVSERDFLTLDHTLNNGGGAVKRRENNYLAYREAELALKSDDPKVAKDAKARFQILCWSCNLSKRHGGVCRHKRGSISDEGVKPSTRAMRDYSREVRKLLGGKCICCNIDESDEFLAIDHIQNDGHLEKKNKNGSRNVLSYYFKIIRAFRSDDPARIAAVKSRYAVLCHNCNASKHYGHGLCIHQRPTNCGTDDKTYENFPVEDRSHWADPSKHPDWPYASALPKACA